MGVKILKFENKFNLEIRDGIYTYCCCDIGYCYKSIDDVQVDYETPCWDMCEIYFEIFFQLCSSNEICYNVTQYTVDAKAIHPFAIPLEESKLGMNNQVMWY